MDFISMLKNSAEERESIVCMGIDPVLEKIPCTKGTTHYRLVKFYSDIFNAFDSENVWPSCFKPNYAFFAQYGFEGLKALKGIIEQIGPYEIPVILDGKRGDIGSTAQAYAREIFEFWNADAATIPPFMGSDSVQPFVEWSEKKGKGVYILNRTSNPGAQDLQDLMVQNKKLFMVVSEKIIEWGSKGRGNVGAVVGATSLDELEQISTYFHSRSQNPVPLLIPGVGRQGGSALEVTRKLKKIYGEIYMHRINSSSGINYAYQKQNTDDFAGAAVKALKELNREIAFTP